jgi:hypothetical protein
MGLNPIKHYNPIIAPPNQNPRSATGDNQSHMYKKLKIESGIKRWKKKRETDKYT